MAAKRVSATLQPLSSQRFADPVTEVLRNGARALLEQAVEAEVQGRMHRRSDREIN